MKDDTFEYIWKETILTNIHDIARKFNAEDKEKYNFYIKSESNIKHEVYKTYENTRKHLKSNYYNTDKSKDKSKNRIDNHKIAACICYSLIKNKVYGFDIKNDINKEIFLSNYEVAYTASLGFIYTNLLLRYRVLGRKDLELKLSCQKKLLVPKTSAGHDEYHTGRIQTLALNDIYGNTFDILTYSDMMFWIEYYNRQKLEESLNPTI